MPGSTQPLLNSTTSYTVLSFLKVIMMRNRFLEKDPKHLQQISAKMERMARILNGLEVDDLRTYPSGQAPFQTLPSELLLCIFTFCKLDELPSSIFPIPLGQICSYFRGVVHKTPGLWTSLDLTFPGLARKDAVVEGMRYWATRASPLQMDLSITISPSTTVLHGDQVFSHIISPIGDQLKTIALRMTTAHLPVFAGLSTEVTLPLLEAVFIDFLDRRALPRRPRSFYERLGFSIDFTNFPSLRRFSITTSLALTGVVESGIFTLPYVQLTSLSLSATSQMVSTLLKQCPNLIDCNIVLEDIYPWSAPTQFIHASIRRFSLTCCLPVMGPFFRGFSFPSLHDLTLRDSGLYSCGYSTKPMATILQPVFKDAPFELRRLRIDMMGICRNPRYLLLPLVEVPTLTHVVFRNCGFLNDPGLQVFEDIISGRSCRSQRLESISFDDTVVSVAYGKVMDIASRSVESGLRLNLKTLYICFQMLWKNARGPTSVVTQRIRALRAKGLQVVFTVECPERSDESSDEEDTE